MTMAIDWRKINDARNSARELLRSMEESPEAEAFLREAFEDFGRTLRSVRVIAGEGPGQRRITEPHVRTMTGLDEAALDGAMIDGTFPAPIFQSGPARCWLFNDVKAWVEQRGDA
jgi:predicted DNA-binding transcriptional regulator AlpA